MYVGYIRKAKKTGNMAKLTSIMCQYNGLTMVYLTLDINVNIRMYIFDRLVMYNFVFIRYS